MAAGFSFFGRVVRVASGAFSFAAVVVVFLVVGTPFSRWLGWAVVVFFCVAVDVSTGVWYASSASAIDGDFRRL